MKILLALLAVSLLVNLVVAVRHFASSGAAAPAPVVAAVTDKSAGGAAQRSGGEAALAALFNETDPQALRDHLRRAGVPEEIIIAFVEARLMAKHRARIRELVGKATSREFWRTSNVFADRTSEEFRELQALSREARMELERLFGPEAAAAPELGATRYGFMTPEKRAQVTRIDQDYAVLRDRLREEAWGFVTPEDRAALKLLESEWRRDLASVLTPEELADYDLRLSPSARAIHLRFNTFDLTQEEYLSLYQLQQNFDGQYGGAMATAEDQRARMAAEAELWKKFESALGAERFAAWQESSQRENQLIQAAARRYNLESGQVQATLKLGPSTIAEAEAIANRNDLTRAQKMAALRDLSTRSRAELERILGPEIAKTYLDNGAYNWLRSLDAGVSVSFRNGRVVYRTLDPGP